MLTKNFKQLSAKQWEQGKFVCVGLDPDYEKLPEIIKNDSIGDSIFEFNQKIIDATADYACAFKPNSAFYEGYGVEGIQALIRTNEYIRTAYPDIPIILDAKRADIGNTNKGYVKAVEDVFVAHAITLHPYLGKEAMMPFLERPDLGVIILCHTSNAGAGEFQELKINDQDLYKIVAQRVNDEWNFNDNCGMVIGATYPEQLAEVRRIAPQIPFLIPGIGAQGGDLEQTVRNGLNDSKSGVMINSSRGIIYASKGSNFAEKARFEAEKLHRSIGECIARL